MRAAVANGTVDEKLSGKIARSGVEAARRKFTPEFINRLDKIVTFQPLGTEQLRKILDIELNMVQQRIFNTSPDRRSCSRYRSTPRTSCWSEGTDLKYGARHLKRAIERLLVQPMSNLIATDQVRGGDWVRVDFDAAAMRLDLREGSRGLAGARHGGSGGSVHLDPGLRTGQWRVHRSRQDAERAIVEASLRQVQRQRCYERGDPAVAPSTHC